MAAPSFQELYDLGKAELVSRRPDLAVLDGDISDMELAAAAAMADRIIGYAADRFRATYVDGASGDDLTKLADDHWKIARLAATQSTGVVRFTRATSGAGTIAAGTVVATAIDKLGNEIQFTTNADASVLISDTIANIPATAVVPARASNVAAGKITRIVSTLFDTFTVTNIAAFAGGSDQESDPDLRERVHRLPEAIRRGTLAALEYGAIQTLGAGVSRAKATEDTSGFVTLYVSDVDGNSSLGMIALVQAEIIKWRAAGIAVTVTGGTPRLIDIQITIGTRLGFSIPAVLSQIVASVTARLEKLTIGETLYRSMIQAAVMAVAPDQILDVKVIEPAAEFVKPGDTELIRANTVTVV